MPICMPLEHLADYDSWRETFYAEPSAAAMQGYRFLPGTICPRKLWES
jgi:hypothetical protein